MGRWGFVQGVPREGAGGRSVRAGRGLVVWGGFQQPGESGCSLIHLIPLSSPVCFFPPRSDKTLQDIVYKLVPGLFKGTAVGSDNSAALGFSVTRSQPPLTPVPRVSCCLRSPLPLGKLLA